MDKITPRWEWRSFRRHFGEAEARFAALTPEGVQESDEVYLLSGAGGNVNRSAAISMSLLIDQPQRLLDQRSQVIQKLRAARAVDGAVVA